MLVIRLRRAGSRNRPFFRVVVTESRSARDGRFVEIIGHYDPRTKPETLVVNGERFAHWVSKGAQPSDTVRTLIRRRSAAEAAADAAGSVASEPVAEPVAEPPVEPEADAETAGS
jgi:small subunit ribosomal protein S16